MNRKAIALASAFVVAIGLGAGNVLAQQNKSRPGATMPGMQMGPGRMMGMSGRGMMGMGECPTMSMSHHHVRRDHHRADRSASRRPVRTAGHAH